MTNFRDIENKIKEWLQTKVDRERYLHSLRVMATIPELAKLHGVDDEPLRLAALLHDCARGMSYDEMLKTAENWELPIRPVDRQSPVLLHGKLAIEMVKRELDLVDPVMVSAILTHTAGHPSMTLSDKLFFLADMIEPGRTFAGVAELRKEAFKDLNRAMLLAIEINEAHLQAKGAVIDPDTTQLRKMLLKGKI